MKENYKILKNTPQEMVFKIETHTFIFLKNDGALGVCKAGGGVINITEGLSVDEAIAGSYRICELLNILM